MVKAFNVIIEKASEDYYVAWVPELRGCHTQAKTLDKFNKENKGSNSVVPRGGRC